jgi:hypothetical protein
MLTIWLIPGIAGAKDVECHLEAKVELYTLDSMWPEGSEEWSSINLCFAQSNKCINLQRIGDGHYRYYGTEKSDHPFVEHPDDWDSLYIRISQKGPIPELSSVYIWYKRARKDREFTFVDWSSGDSRPLPRELTEKYITFDLSSEVDYSRKKIVAEVMGYTNVTQESVDALYESMPAMVKSAINDIGQSGLEKYVGRPDASENGCDEFCCWHYINSNLEDAYTILDHYCCPSDPSAVTVEDCCPGYPGCFEARCFSYDPYARPSPFVCTESIFPRRGFKQHGRLYKIVFRIENGDRTEVEKIVKVDPDVGDGVQDDWVTTDIEYQPKIGDLMVQWANCDDATWHMMIMLDDSFGPGVQVDTTSKSLTNLLVIGGAQLNLAVNREIAEINERCPNGQFYNTLYVVEMK